MVLTVYVIFMCEVPIDIFVNMVAVQVFSKLDDDTVRAWYQRYVSVIDTAGLYFQWKKENGDDADFEEYYLELIELRMKDNCDGIWERRFNSAYECRDLATSG